MKILPETYLFINHNQSTAARLVFTYSTLIAELFQLILYSIIISDLRILNHMPRM